MVGEQIIPAPRERVWAALNDPEVLKQSIPGCQEMSKRSPTEFEAKVVAKVGPVQSTFAGNVILSDLNPPESYRISGEGKGGAAGFAKGGASVRLDEREGATRITYDVDAQVGGKLAQIGSRLIDSTARKMADDFFSRFAQIVAGAEPVVSEQMTVEAEPPAKRPAKKGARKAATKRGPARPRKAEARKTTARGTPEAPPEPAAAERPPTAPRAPKTAAPAGSPADDRIRAERSMVHHSGLSQSTLLLIGGAVLVAVVLLVYIAAS